MKPIVESLWFAIPITCPTLGALTHTPAFLGNGIGSVTKTKAFVFGILNSIVTNHS